MTTLRVFVLLFESRSAVERAFGLVADEPRVASCVIEAEKSQIRFLAPNKLGRNLMQRIYNFGGLTWCTSHELSREAELARRRLAPSELCDPAQIPS